MSQVLHITPDQEFVYRVDILRVFKGDSYGRYTYRKPDEPRVRLETPELVAMAFHSTPRAARNYGSYRTGRRKWYNNMNKESFWSYEQRKYIEPDQGPEPDLDYKVYEIPIKLAMGEAREIPQLKRLYELT